jgi:hypothetical protein
VTVSNLQRHKFEVIDSLDAESREAILNTASDDDQKDSLVFRRQDGSVVTASELRLLASLSEDDIASYRRRSRKRSGDGD